MRGAGFDDPAPPPAECCLGTSLGLIYQILEHPRQCKSLADESQPGDQWVLPQHLRSPSQEPRASKRQGLKLFSVINRLIAAYQQADDLC